ncbi:MAG: hypothetical protein ACRCZI_11385 [Cetobacterium sp.]
MDISLVMLILFGIVHLVLAICLFGLMTELKKTQDALLTAFIKIGQALEDGQERSPAFLLVSPKDPNDPAENIGTFGGPMNWN